MNILEEALKAIKDRGQMYGDAASLYSEVCTAYKAITNNHITEKDIILLMILIKLKRSRVSPDDMDHYVDIAGYAHLMFNV